MSRFAVTSLIALIAFFAIGLSLSGWTRLLAFTGFWIVYFTIVGCGIAFIQLQFFGPVVCRGSAGRTRVALTFDDGPDPVVTPAVLDLLKRENIAATFFCIGEKVVEHPEIAARIAAEGHGLGNHTYHHGWWTPFLGRRGLRDEVEQTQQAIDHATGITPIYMRPPVGLTNPHYARVLRQARLQMIGWDVRSMDTVWDQQRVIDRVMRKSRDGSIILLHDAGTSSERVVAIVTAVIGELRSRGFEFERVDRLLVPTGGVALATP